MRWMRESRCYFFLSYAQKVRVRVPPVSYAYVMVMITVSSSDHALVMQLVTIRVNALVTKQTRNIAIGFLCSIVQ